MSAGSLTVQGMTLRPERLRLLQRGVGQIEEQRRPARAFGGLDQPWRRAAEIVDVETRSPGRGSRLAALDIVVGAALDRQAHAWNLRREAAEHRERAPIERLHVHARGRAGIADRLYHRGGKGLRIGHVGAGRRRHLGFDVEAHVIGLRAPDEIEHLRKRRNAGAVDRTLLGEARSVRRAGLEAADVVALDFRQRDRAQCRPAPARNTPSGPRVVSGLSQMSCWTTTTPSLLMPRSNSSVETPIDSARAKPSSVFSGASPRAPR